MTGLAGKAMAAVVIVRDGRIPAGADEAVAECGGTAVIVGPGASEDAAQLLPSAERVWWAPTPAGPLELAAALAPPLSEVTVVVLPASPDGRDLAPRLAARMGRPLLAGAVRVAVEAGTPCADLLRVDGRVVVPVRSPAPAVCTLWPGARAGSRRRGPLSAERLDLSPAPDGRGEGRGDPAVKLLGVVEPDPATMDLADAPRVLAGGAGLVGVGASDEQARACFDLLGQVAAALGASAGATRVVTDAGWMGYDRQIGTTGVTLAPDLYVAFGISGASQHVGGIGDPRHVVSVNLDASCPMTGLADLGLVADAPMVLAELGRRLGLTVPDGLDAEAGAR